MDSTEAGYRIGSSPYKHTRRLLNTVAPHHHGWMEGWINNEHTHTEDGPDRLRLTAYDHRSLGSPRLSVDLFSPRAVIILKSASDLNPETCWKVLLFCFSVFMSRFQ